MDQIFISSDKIPSITAIHNSFIKSYMLEANGSYVKVYLYLSMCLQSGSDNFSISSLADQMDNTEKDIIRALKYWEKKGIVALKRGDDGKEIIGIEFLTPGQANTVEFVPKTSSDLSAVKVCTPLPLETLPKEETTNTADFKWTCQIVERFLDRPISSAEINLITYLYETVHFSSDLILHLYEYCCNLGKTNVKYVEKVALSWAEKGIKTPEEAENYSAQYNNSHSAIAKAFGLGRPLASIESSFVKRWQEDWHMDIAIILEACNRTMLAIHKADFKYAEAILNKWHQQKVHSLQELQAYDNSYARKKAASDSSSSGTTPRSSAPKRKPKNQFQTFQQREITQAENNELEKLLLSK